MPVVRKDGASLLTESVDVTFRHLAIPTGQGEISGICLWYRSKEAAESLFAFLHRYLAAPGTVPRRLIEVSASQEESGDYLLTITAGLEDTVRHIEISGVAQEYIQRIQGSLRVFSYYLLAAGYDADNGEAVLLPLSQYHLFLSRITINGSEYTGNPRCSFPWTQLVRSDFVYFVPPSDAATL